MSLFSNVIRWWRLDVHRKLLLINALYLITWGCISLKVFPFLRISHWLGVADITSSKTVSEDQLRQARYFAWAINAVANHLPWTASCLAKALAFQQWLKQQGIPATVYIGVGKETGTSCGLTLTAHAWVCCGAAILMGQAGQELFQPIAHFGWPSTKS